jgi:excisionase family DNA binding protein
LLAGPKALLATSGQTGDWKRRWLFMATAKRDLTDLTVQGPRVIDVRDDLVSLEHACEVLNVSIATLYRYMADGRLRFQRVNGNRVIRRSDLLGCKDNRSVNEERMRMQRRAAAHALHSLYDSREITKAARDAFLARFDSIVDPDGVLTPRERNRRAGQARKAYFTDLARRSSKARSQG